MPKLNSTYADFVECEVTTKANTKATIPAGRHHVVENQTQGGGASISWPGSQIEVNYVELQRLVKDGLATQA